MTDDQDTPEARIARLREELALVPHPEGGFYREHYRSADSPRGSSSAIYFLLPAGAFSAWHRVGQDELWHHYEGSSIELHLIDDWEGYRVHTLGPVLGAQRPCVAVPAGVWQAARPIGDGYTFVGCTVAPGFTFSDWELADASTRAALAARHPAAAQALRELARD